MTVKMNKIPKDLSQIELQDLQHETCMKAMFQRHLTNVKHDTGFLLAQNQRGLSKQELFNFMVKSIGRTRKIQLVDTYHHVFVIPPTEKNDHFGIVTFSSPDVVKAIMFAADNRNKQEYSVLDDSEQGIDHNLYASLCPNGDSVNSFTNTHHRFVSEREGEGYISCDDIAAGNVCSIERHGIISYLHGNRKVAENVEDNIIHNTPFIRMWHYNEYGYQSRGYQYFGYEAPLAQEMIRTYLKTNKLYVAKALYYYSKFADLIIQRRLHMFSQRFTTQGGNNHA